MSAIPIKLEEVGRWLKSGEGAQLMAHINDELIREQAAASESLMLAVDSCNGVARDENRADAETHAQAANRFKWLVEFLEDLQSRVPQEDE